MNIEKAGFITSNIDDYFCLRLTSTFKDINSFQNLKEYTNAISMIADLKETGLDLIKTENCYYYIYSQNKQLLNNIQNEVRKMNKNDELK